MNATSTTALQTLSVSMNQDLSGVNVFKDTRVTSVPISMSVRQIFICVTKTQTVLTMMEATFAAARQDLEMSQMAVAKILMSALLGHIIAIKKRIVKTRLEAMSARNKAALIYFFFMKKISIFTMFMLKS